MDAGLFTVLLREVEAFFEPLPDKPDETARTVLEALWRTARGSGDEGPLPELDDAGVAALRNLIGRKREGVPLAHLTGRQRFMDLELLAGPEALIPRRETEILGRAALAAIRGKRLAIDVCTGSGNIALVMAKAEPGARVYGADLSEGAVALARRNAELCGVADRLEFRAGDLFAPFEDPRFLGCCDVVSCNPPYISAAKVSKMHPEIADHEPSMAFNGGALGVSILMRLLKEAPRFLKPGGTLCFEVGLGQGPGMEKQLARMPWVESVEAQKDSAGAVRALVARTR